MMLRIAQLADAPEVHRLIFQLGYTLSQEQVERNMRAYQEDPDQGLFVVQMDTGIIGLLAFDVAQTFHRLEKQMRVVSLVVDAEHRCLGVGKRLLEAVEEEARRRGCWVVEVTSSSLREKEGVHVFYERVGYQKNGKETYTARDSKIGPGCVGQQLFLKLPALPNLFKLGGFGTGAACSKFKAPPCHNPIFEPLPVYFRKLL